MKPLFVDLETAATMVALSVSTFELEVRNRRAPAPRQLSGRRVGWLVAELEQWAAERPVSQLPPPPCTGRRKRRGSEGLEAAA